MEAFYAEAITVQQSYWGEADTDTRFYLGDQTLWNDLYGNLPANRRRQFNFNRIRRVVDMISGYQRRNRKSTIVMPKENADAETADQLTKVLMSIHEQEGTLEAISESFLGALITGLNFLHVWVDYREDPISGSIKVDNCSYNSFLVDPYFKKPDLSDCNGIWKRTWLTRRQIISLLPEHADEILGLMGNESGTRDGKFQYSPESYGFNYNKLLTYDEFYYRDFRTQKMLVDTQTGETLEWKGDNETLKLYLQTYPTVTTIDQEVPTVMLGIVVQNKVMYHGPNPSGLDNYPFVPVFGYYHAESPYFPWRIQGVVRGLRDAQYLYNRRRIIELDILESQVNSGWIFKENAPVNIKDMYELQGQGRGVAVKQEANLADVQQIPAPQIPPSMIQLSEILAREVMEISGVNEELLGSAVDDKAGILSMLRQGAGLTTLQGLFDNLDHAQKLLGKLELDLIQQNYTPGKIKNFLEGKEPTPQFYNKMFGKYHAVVEEGLNTATQKQMQFAQMLHLREAGVPIPDDMLLEAATLTNKKQLIEAVQSAQQAQQQSQELQGRLQAEQLQAQTQLAVSTAKANEGLGLERISRVQENQALAVERHAKAEQAKDAALLDLVKAAKEIDDIDIRQIEKLITIARLTKEQIEPPQPNVPQGT